MKLILMVIGEIVKKYLQDYNNLSRKLLREKLNQNENIVVSERIIGKIARGVY